MMSLCISGGQHVVMSLCISGGQHVVIACVLVVGNTS